jgi:hypothetical protein
MDRAFSSGASGSAPTAPASPSVGYPTAGNPSTGTPATKPGPYWYHMIAEELMAVISAAGITPAQGNLNQLLTALRSTGVFQTPAQFDITTKVPTTAFTWQQGFHFQNAVGVPLTANTTLSITQAGHWFEIQISGLTITLPTLASCPSGMATYTFRAPIAFTLKGNGVDGILNSTGVMANTLNVAAGESLSVVGNGPSGQWYVLANGFGSASFAKSLATSGYQKLPSGLIIQWGSCTMGYGGALASATGTQVLTTLPIAFPNAFTAITVVHNGGIPQATAAQIVNTSQFNTSSTYGSSIGGTYMAIGY